MFLVRLPLCHIRRTPLSLVGLIPVVKRFYVSVNIKYGNILTAFLLTFSAVAGIRLDMDSFCRGLFLFDCFFHNHLATSSLKELAGLNAGILWAGIIMVVFLLMFRAVFSARVFTMKEPKPRRYTFSPWARPSFTTVMNCSTTERTAVLSIPVVLAISLTISALVILS